MAKDYRPDAKDSTVNRDALNHAADTVHSTGRTYPGPGGDASGFKPAGARSTGDPKGEHPSR